MNPKELDVSAYSCCSDCTKTLNSKVHQGSELSAAVTTATKTGFGFDRQAGRWVGRQV
jgi:hypothetical protein